MEELDNLSLRRVQAPQHVLNEYNAHRPLFAGAITELAIIVEKGEPVTDDTFRDLLARLDEYRSSANPVRLENLE